MANTLVTTQLAATEAALMVGENVLFPNLTNRSMEQMYSPGVGKTINVNIPSVDAARSFKGDSSSTVSQNITEASVPVVIEDKVYIRKKVTDDDLSSLDYFNERVNIPAVKGIVAYVNNFFNRKITYGFGVNQAGTAGTEPSTLANIIDAKSYVYQNMLYDAPLVSTLTPTAYANFQKLNVFNSLDFGEDRARALRDGFLGKLNNVTYFQSPGAGTLDYGNIAGTIVVKGASQTGTSLIIDGFTYNSTEANASGLQAGMVHQGCEFTVAGITGTYKVTADAVVVGNETTLTITPALSSDPANDAAITFTAAASRQLTNVMYDKSAVAGVVLPIKSSNLHSNLATAFYQGIGITVAQDKFNISDFSTEWVWTCDLACKVVQPNYGCVF